MGVISKEVYKAPLSALPFNKSGMIRESHVLFGILYTQVRNTKVSELSDTFH